MPSVQSLPACPYPINELEEGEEEGQAALWRRGVPVRTFSMTLKSSVSYVFPLAWHCLPMFLLHRRHGLIVPVCERVSLCVRLGGCVLLSFSALG